MSDDLNHHANSPDKTPDKIDRRKFIGAAAATAGVMFIKPSLVRGTAANSAVRVGLLGCGGRGTEDATNLVDTGGARVVALADLFQDQLDTARASFDKLQLAKGYSAIDASQLFLGPNAYQQIASSKELDAIVIATPPYYHPRHLEAVVAAGKHVYLEKPVAVDVPGALKVIEIGKRAEGKLSLDVGFQIRDCPPVRGNGPPHSRWSTRQDCLRRSSLSLRLHRPSRLAERLARRASPPQLGVRPRSLRRHHRGTEHSRH